MDGQEKTLWATNGWDNSPTINLGSSLNDKEKRITSVGVQTSSSPRVKPDSEQKYAAIVFDPQQGFIFESLPMSFNPPSKSMLLHVLGPTRMLDINSVFHPPGDEPLEMVVGLPETATFGMFIKTLTKDYNKTHPKNPVEETLEAWIVEFPSLPKTDFNFRLKDLIKGYSHL
eukprot:TRINITY_DN920_c0_g1_i5.p1 TRINITY_DN920_c0_g1~~TRINITY_DN920_c0_g1_i5.p1  ORF type:complete len:172 (+),score=36.78 TRINITY_DN920_c0_g1_i5:275-790(+)